MEFEVGDQVIHPAHGLGEITAIKDIELVEGFEQYYEISIPAISLQINIPVRRAHEIGLRPIMKEKRVNIVLNMLAESPQHLDDDYRKRQAIIEDKLRSCDPNALAEVVRDLRWRQAEASLTRHDGHLLRDAEELLANEIAATLQISREEALATIEASLT